MDWSEATAAPFIVVLEEREWAFYPLRLQDWGALEQFMRSQVISSVKGALSPGDLMNGEIVDAACKRAAKISFARVASEEEGAEADIQGLLGTIGAVIEIAWLSLRKPKMTRSQVADLLQKMDFGEVVTHIMKRSQTRGGGGASKKEEPTASMPLYPPSANDTGMTPIRSGD